MDGTFDDPIWQQAVPITDFRQKEPYEGEPATESTEVRILYTHKEIYFGIACHDSVPREIVATQLRRDVTQELDDYFELVIDSRHDRRKCLRVSNQPAWHTVGCGLTSEELVAMQIPLPSTQPVRTSVRYCNLAADLSLLTCAISTAMRLTLPARSSAKWTFVRYRRRGDIYALRLLWLAEGLGPSLDTSA